MASAVAAPYERRAAGGGAVMYRYYEDFPAEGYEWAYGARCSRRPDPHE